MEESRGLEVQSRSRKLLTTSNMSILRNDRRTSRRSTSDSGLESIHLSSDLDPVELVSLTNCDTDR